MDHLSRAVSVDCITLSEKPAVVGGAQTVTTTSNRVNREGTSLKEN